MGCLIFYKKRVIVLLVSNHLQLQKKEFFIKVFKTSLYLFNLIILPDHHRFRDDRHRRRPSNDGLNERE